MNNSKKLKIKAAIIGNPNSGKSTVFNALTGSTREVGNWPGVTVSKASGTIRYNNFHVELTDLPGLYELDAATMSQDEQIARHTLYSEEYQLIINIVDSTNIERNLYLTLQLIELGLPVLIVCNMSDIAEQRGIQLDIARLQELLQVPIVQLNATKRNDIKILRQTIQQYAGNPPKPPILDIYPDVIKSGIRSMHTVLGNHTYSQHSMISWLDDRTKIPSNMPRKARTELAEIVKHAQHNIAAEIDEDIDLVITSVRYEFIHNIAKQAITKPSRPEQFGDKLDHAVLHKWWSIPIFFLMMYFTFMTSIVLGGALQPIVTSIFSAIFVDGVRDILSEYELSESLISFMADTIGEGIVLVSSFIPILAILYFIMALLEDSGYMARAAFIIDRLLKFIGLPGKALIPIIIGFGCNVPGVMATRILDNVRDRIAVVMMMPFISCSARLSVYSIFCAAFFPTNGHQVVFALYIIGIVMAVITGFLCRQVLMHGEESYFLMELPNYHVPKIRHIIWRALHNTGKFVFGAGKLIILIFVLVTFLGNINKEGKYTDTPEQSLLAETARYITPVFSPLGIQQENWPATVGIITGILAKEVVIGTLDALYYEQAQSVNASGSSSINNKTTSTYSLQKALQHNFSSTAIAFAYLLFILLYFPCLATFVAIGREISWHWAIVSMVWSTTIGYAVATTFWQIASRL